MVDDDLDLDFKINLGLIIFAKFSDIQKMKVFLNEHPEMRVVYQTIDKGKLKIVRGSGYGD